LLPKKTRSSADALLLPPLATIAIALFGVLGVFPSEQPCDTLRWRAESMRGEGPAADALSDDSAANDGVRVSDHITHGR